MRSNVLTLALALCTAVALRAGDFPTLKLPLPDLSVAQGEAIPPLDLRTHFEVTGIQGQVVQFRCVLGAFNLELLPAAAPITVSNFLRYANAGRYVNNVVHRSDTGLGVIQGGQFSLTSTSLPPIETYPPIPLEYNLPNARGTIAMARGTNIHSATCQYFINTKDNTTTLGQANDGGYAVFGRVTGTGMTVVDAIAALPTYAWGTNYLTWPMINYAGGTAPVTYTNLIAMSTAQVVPLFPDTAGQLAVATFSVTNSNPALATVTVSGSLLNIVPIAGRSGVAELTVIATDSNGNAVQDTLHLLVCGYALSSSSQTFGTAGGTGSFWLTNTENCNWTATTTNTWLRTTNSGSGTGTVSYQVLPNPSGPYRTGSITIGGQTFTVVQQGEFSASDFNGDGIDDLVFQNSLGQLTGWRFNGAGQATDGWTIYGSGLGAWKVVALADLNLDGQADLIFQLPSGSLFGWLMGANGYPVDSVNIYSGNVYGWSVITAADVNRDGIADLIWQSASGSLLAWLMNAQGHPTTAVTIYSGDVGTWRLAAAGDLNGDGIPDLVWQTPTGSVVGWLMNGSGGPTIGISIYDGTVPSWRVAAMRDLNSDGIPDLIWQSTSGSLLGWLMDGRGKPTTALNIYSGALWDWLAH